MPFKSHAPTSVESQPTEIILEIDGLRANDDGSFTFTGVKPFEFHQATIEHMQMNLTDQGIPRQLADRLVDEALASIHIGLLADALAQRTRRIG